MKTRYAPSPTGLQHIGGIRTALFCYLSAKAQNGGFILRIEDTDRVRYSPESEQDIDDSFNFLGIKYDEKYIQSQRFDIYRQKALALIESGCAYKCFCASQRLDELRATQQEAKSSTLGYDRHCQNLTEKEIKENEGKPFVIRFKIPTEGFTEFDDAILGHQKWENKSIPADPILIKSDGFPTYHLANVVDDNLMGITHVYRAQEWLSSTPLHILLYKALGIDNPPVFAHLPMVIGEDGKKLSKRHGSTALQEFIKVGYLKEAIINHVSLLGFSYDDKTTYLTLNELEKIFDIKKVSKSSAVFDYKKLNHFNEHYIRQKSDEELIELLTPFLLNANIPLNTNEEKDILKKSIHLIKERITLLSEAPDKIRFLYFSPQLEGKDFDIKKQATDVRIVLGLFLDNFDNIFADTQIADIEQRMKNIYTQNNIKPKDFFMPVRISLTGSQGSLPLIDSIFIMGYDEAKKRLSNSINLLN